jgi:hypothetical protein
VRIETSGTVGRRAARLKSLMPKDAASHGSSLRVAHERVNPVLGSGSHCISQTG